MAAPTFVALLQTATDAGDIWSEDGNDADWGGAGAVIILQILQDGNTNGAVALTGSANINNLAGSAGWTKITGTNADGSFPVGSAAAARQHLWIGRATGTFGASQFPLASGTNSTSEDLYIALYAFSGVSTGTTLSTVIENGSAGATTNSAGTSATASDASVQTLGNERLALNFIAVNDDNAIADFSGESGGSWTELGEYAEAGGTDGAVGLYYATMASAGTIDGGTASITDSDAWGVVGFALLPVASTKGYPFRATTPRHTVRR